LAKFLGRTNYDPWELMSISKSLPGQFQDKRPNGFKVTYLKLQGNNPVHTATHTQKLFKDFYKMSSPLFIQNHILIS